MISAAVIAAGMLASCSNKEIVDEQPETDGVSASVLNIVPTVGTDTRAGFVPKTEWAVNDAMGLFMYKATGWGDAYPRYDAQNNKSTKTAAGWSQAKPVYLLSDKATIWAYYPYNQAVADGTKVPVPINAGTSVDYMWGKSTNQVSVIETDAVIPMKHAVTRNFAASLFRNIKYFTLRKLYLCRKWMQKRLQKTTTTGITLPNFDFLA